MLTLPQTLVFWQLKTDHDIVIIVELRFWNRTQSFGG